MILVMIFFLILTQVLATSATDYCSEIMKCNGITNSGCDCEFGQNCQAPREHQITNEIRKSLIVAHNKYREKVASGQEIRGGLSGGATNMYALQYDLELEHTATCWNKKCTFAHDLCRITKNFRPAGQNLYWSSGKGCDWDFNLNQATQLWYEEVKDMTPSCLLSYGSGCDTSKVGHFSQMVWAQTTHIGCSLVEYAGPSCQITCNYGTAGNFLREPIYKSGPPASDCKYKSNLYKHLCLLTENQEEDDEEDSKSKKGTGKKSIVPGKVHKPRMAIIRSRSSSDVIRIKKKHGFFMISVVLMLSFYYN